MPPADMPQLLSNVHESTDRLTLVLGSLTDADARRPSLLPGWSNGHVITHLARNADALNRVLAAAQRGERVSMYDSEESRNADIEAGSGRPAAELLTDLAESSARFAATCAATSDDVWDFTVQFRMSQEPASGVPGRRWREVEIHGVDLDIGYGPDSWPAPFVTYLLELDHRLADRLPDGASVQLEATDTGQRWAAGPGTGSALSVIRGPAWAIAAWLVGRPQPVRAALDVTGADAPTLASWG